MPAALDPPPSTGQPSRPNLAGPNLAGSRLRAVDLMIGLLALGSVTLVGAATVTARLEAGRAGPPDAAIAEAIQTLRRSFGYDGIVHELERLRRSGDPAALAALEDSLREARTAIGLLRPALGEADQAVGRALDQLDAAGRRLETLLRTEAGDLPARIVDLPVLEPLFVLDGATLALRDALHAADEPRIQQMFALTLAAACLLAATALLLAFWVRRSVLAPLRRLVADLAAGSSAGLDRLAARPDEIGSLAAALRGQPAAAAPAIPGPPSLLPDQGDLLRRIQALLESLAGTRAGPSGPVPPPDLSTSPPPLFPAGSEPGIPIFAATRPPEPARPGSATASDILQPRQDDGAEIRRAQAGRESGPGEATRRTLSLLSPERTDPPNEPEDPGRHGPTSSAATGRHDPIAAPGQSPTVNPGQSETIRPMRPLLPPDPGPAICTNEPESPGRHAPAPAATGRNDPASRLDRVEPVAAAPGARAPEPDPIAPIGAAMIHSLSRQPSPDLAGLDPLAGLHGVTAPRGEPPQDQETRHDQTFLWSEPSQPASAHEPGNGGPVRQASSDPTTPALPP